MLGGDMTGAFLRVQREGKWDNVEVEHLTDAERESLLANDPRLMQWLHLCCKKLVESEKLFNQLVEDGILEFKE